LKFGILIRLLTVIEQNAEEFKRNQEARAAIRQQP
jgi:hypothetical protein